MGEVYTLYTILTTFVLKIELSSFYNFVGFVLLNYVVFIIQTQNFDTRLTTNFVV